MTIAVDLGRKATKQTNKRKKYRLGMVSKNILLEGLNRLQALPMKMDALIFRVLGMDFRRLKSNNLGQGFQTIVSYRCKLYINWVIKLKVSLQVFYGCHVFPSCYILDFRKLVGTPVIGWTRFE